MRSARGGSGTEGPPSHRARAASAAVRCLLRIRPPGNEEALARWCRRLFGLLAYLAWPRPPGVAIAVASRPIRGEWIVPRAARDGAPVIYYLHGGGFVSCSPRTHRLVTCGLARRVAARVFALDYRLAPEHRFPAALDDAVAGYRWLLEAGVPPSRIAFAGDSAGGGLALAALVRLRDLGLPLPRCAACFSPWTDLSGSGTSVRRAVEGAACRPDAVARFARLYLGLTPPTHPYASPLFADLSGLPPLYLQVGSSEILLDDSVRFHQRATAAGVESELSVWEGVPHGWQVLAWALPEGRAALEDAAGWIRVRLAEHGPDSAPRLSWGLRRKVP